MTSDFHFKYTDRDYLSLRDQLIQYLRSRLPNWVPGDPNDGQYPDPNDFATALVEANAYLGDLFSYYLDRAAQEASPISAQSPSNVLAWGELFGYTPALARSARVDLTFTASGTDAIVIPDGLRVKNTKNFRFEVKLPPEDNGARIIAPSTSQVLPAYEGVTVYEDGVPGVELGQSNGLPGQQFRLPDTRIDARFLSIAVYAFINGTETATDWHNGQRLLDYGPDHNVFSIKTRASGQLDALFGDGISGKIPPVGYTLHAYYRTTSGAMANDPLNVPVGSVTIIDSSWDRIDLAELAGLEVTNTAVPYGGSDADTLETVKRKTVFAAGFQRRAVTAGDYAASARMHGGVLDASCTARVWSRPTVWIHPRSESAYNHPATRDELVKEVREMMRAHMLVGTSPQVYLGSPTPLNLEVEAYVTRTVKHSFIKEQIRKMIIERYAFDKLVFDEGISAQDILDLLTSKIPSSTLRFILPTLSPVFIDQPREEDIVAPTTPGDPGDFLAQRYLPMPGQLLYIGDDNIEITVHGGVKDI